MPVLWPSSQLGCTRVIADRAHACDRIRAARNVKREDVFGSVLHAHLGVAAAAFDAGAGFAQMRQRVTAHEAVIPDDFQGRRLLRSTVTTRRPLYSMRRAFSLH